MAADDELPPPPKGRIAPGSLLDTRDQLALYRDVMGLEAAKRQVRLRREQLDRERKTLPKAGRRSP